MGIVPEPRLQRLEFYESHLAPWTANAANIGVAPAAVTALGNAAKAARDAYDAHLAAKNASKAATQAFYDAMTTLHSGPGMGSDMIMAIKNYALTKNDPTVYTLAQIPPPSSGTPVPPPGMPYLFQVDLEQSGAVRLNWKCNNPSGAGGTVYEVKRSLSGTMGPFTFVGTSGQRAILDDTLPSGASPVTYQVTAVRSTSRGQPALFTVTFGVGGGGITVQAVQEGEGDQKLAA